MTTLARLPSEPNPLAVLVERARVYAEAQRADRTRRAYRFDWIVFSRWCGVQGLEPEDADDARLAVYFAWLADQGYAPATIDRASHGLGARLRQLDPTWALGSASRGVLRGIRRRSTYRAKPKKALVAAELHLALEHAGEGLLGVRNRALLLVGFAGGFRRSELVALNVEDLAFSAVGVRIAIRRSKTDQEGRGQEKGIVRSKGEACPVAALRAWLDQTGAKGEAPVFVAMTRWGLLEADADGMPRRLSPGAVAHLVKRSCRGAGLGAADYAGHSLRAGFVTEAALRKKGINDIMRQTGHRSLAQVQRYMRHANVFSENASEGLLD